MNKLVILSTCAVALALAGCESTPAPKQEEKPQPVEPISGQSALYKMYQVARVAWAPDAQVLTASSIHLQEVPQVPGKAGAWQATFTSQNLGRKRSYTYSVVESASNNLHKEVFAGQQESWSGRAGLESPFPIAAVSIDTTAAYKTALEHAEDYDKKNPGLNIAFSLDRTSKFPNPAWRVIWGESVETAGLSIYVDASVGTFLARMH